MGLNKNIPRNVSHPAANPLLRAARLLQPEDVALSGQQSAMIQAPADVPRRLKKKRRLGEVER